MGIALFERDHRAITLTAEGRELLNGVTVALRHLASATHGLRPRDTCPVLTVKVDTSIAHLWLLPRLAGYLDRSDAARLDLTVSDDHEAAPDSDIAILHGDGGWSGYESHPLFLDDIFPICSPSYLESHPIATPQDLLEADLIDLDYSHWNWINWGIWLTESNLDPSGSRITIRTNSYVTQLDAARTGLGVALGWAHLVDKDLQNDALVRPLPDSIETTYGYYLLLREDAGVAAQNLAQTLLKMDDFTHPDRLA